MRYKYGHKQSCSEINKRYREKLGEVFKKRAIEYAKSWRENHPEESRRIALDYYYKNRITIRVQKRVGARKLKIEILTHYANEDLSCVWCGESRLACLSIDHINGDGYKDRKSANKNGTRLYQWLKAHNYPNGFQTLCMNCQFIKREQQGEFRYAPD